MLSGIVNLAFFFSEINLIFVYFIIVDFNLELFFRRLLVMKQCDFLLKIIHFEFIVMIFKKVKKDQH